MLTKMQSQSSTMTSSEDENEAKCSCSGSHNDNSNSTCSTTSTALSVSFREELSTIHEIPCVLRHGERLVLKGATSNPTPIMDYEKSRLWFTPRELQMTKRLAQLDIENVLRGRASIEEPRDESSSSDDQRVCIRGLEMLHHPIRGVHPRVTYVDEVLIQQSRQRADQVENDEAIANAGRTFSKTSLEEALERGHEDYVEAKRIHALPCYEPPKRRSSLQQARRFLRRTSKGLQKRLSFTSSKTNKPTTTTTYVN